MKVEIVLDIEHCTHPSKGCFQQYVTVHKNSREKPVWFCLFCRKLGSCLLSPEVHYYKSLFGVQKVFVLPQFKGWLRP